MNIFEYWYEPSRTRSYVHPGDKIVLRELADLINRDFELRIPPGQYFGPLKTAKIVLCYANPSIDGSSPALIQEPESHTPLFEQLNGKCDYPYELPGWDKWFRPRANSLLDGNIELAAKLISVFNLVPYASKNMDNVQKIANCLPSTWMAQQHLRNVLIPKATAGKILLIMCRSARLWGLCSSHGSDNILINNVWSGFTPEVKSKVIVWRKERCI